MKIKWIFILLFVILGFGELQALDFSVNLTKNNGKIKMGLQSDDSNPENRYIIKGSRYGVSSIDPKDKNFPSLVIGEWDSKKRELKISYATKNKLKIRVFVDNKEVKFIEVSGIGFLTTVDLLP